MHLAGQGGREDGYAMAALLTMIAVMSILMSAALPVWRHEMRREREAELAFRGEQYQRAIGLYFARHRSYPPNVDILVQQKFLRKKYKDPITGEDFRPVFAADIQAEEARTQRGRGRVQVGRPAGPRQPGGAGGLMGVASRSEDTSIRIYKGRTKYHQWDFRYAQAAARPGAPQGAPGRPGPGGPRRPGRPGGGSTDRPRPDGDQPFPRPRGGPGGSVRPPGGTP